MPVPDWFRERRFGGFLQLSVATVPGFAPVGQAAERYWPHCWATGPVDPGLRPAPLPEVQAWHAEHRPDVAAYDDFIPDLRLGEFDAAAVASLAVDAGMRYLVAVARHHDGFCWWDTAHSDRNSSRLGPRRDVVAEVAEAAGDAGLVLGLAYSLLDWSDPLFADPTSSAAESLLPQVEELVERFRPAMLWADGHPGRSSVQRRSDEVVVERYRATMRAHGLPALVNDRWQAPGADVRTFDDDLPVELPAGPWELRRGIARSIGFNRAERPGDHLTGAGIVRLLTEVVARGGNLLLGLGPRADGTVPDAQQEPLRAAGRWVAANADVIHGSRPFDVWGDDEIRYTVGADDRIAIIDLLSRPERRIAHLSPHRYPVEAVDGAARWSQDEAGLHVEAHGDDPGLGRVLRVRLRARRRITLAVRGETTPGTVRIGPRRFRTVGEALLDAQPGEVVLLGRGRHASGTERFPLVVPAGVTLKGAGTETVLDGEDLPFATPVVLVAGAGAALEHVSAKGAARPDDLVTAPTVLIAGGDGARVERCTVDGSIAVQGSTGASVEWNVVTGGNLSTVGSDRVSLRGNRQEGLPRGVGMHVVGGTGHRIEANTVTGDLCGLRLEDATDARLSANFAHGRWWSVHLDRCTSCDVTGNRAAGMRAFTVTGGRGNRLAANVADGTDTGVLLEGGADGTEVTANHLTGCRVGVLAWRHVGSEIEGNRIHGSRDHDRVDGPNGP